MVFKLSEDLRQYFTDEIVEIENDTAKVLETIIGYQENCDYLLDTLEENIDMLADVLQESIADIETLNLHVFMDILNEDIYTKIFASFLKYEDFELEIIADNSMWEFFDYDNKSFIDIENEFPRQVRKEVKKFYEKLKDECYYNGRFDDSIAETLYFRGFRLNIKNKKIARKLRKNYQKNGCFYQLCNEIEFCMKNGQFIYMAGAYMDSYGYYNYYGDYALLCSAIKNLNIYLDTRRKFNSGIKYVLDEASVFYGYNDNIIRSILNLMITNEEVII